MGKIHTKDLKRFLRPYPKNVQALALALREWVWDLYPDANELIYDNYNALAFGWSPTERLGHTFCSIAVLPRYVHFGFYWGNELRDPGKKLEGKGSQYRYIKVLRIEDFPRTYIRKLTREAYANSMMKIADKKEIVRGKTFV